jgi:hypothetical protein
MKNIAAITEPINAAPIDTKYAIFLMKDFLVY